MRKRRSLKFMTWFTFAAILALSGWAATLTVVFPDKLDAQLVRDLRGAAKFQAQAEVQP